ncbi:Chromatin SPT2 [Arabidopsis thaliana x Arabidopsis arenosa]|uniref:Chromatin SPT2 n=1 Tax=Arabidopsis thaliana x Arabidopsis arenosa TaxID=1240361 RepID=A0A8T1Y9T0_9BRAS|nr:Chromatin SPT2 [Arabidopsis thaliana x Arabidopsis arenosa]
MQNGNTIIAPTLQTHESKSNLPYNDFGSFFGPSQTVIASRVLQESKSLLENETSATKMLNSIQNKTSPVQMNASEVKRKAEKLKDARDYSFLFSDDAQLPVSIKEPPKSRPSPRESQMNHSKQASSGSQMLPRPGSSTNVEAHMSGDSARKYSRKQKSINKNGQPSSKLGPQRPLSSSKPLTYDPKQQRVKQRNVSLELTRSQLSSTKHQLIRKPPLKRAHQLKKKKKSVKMSEDDLAALQMVRQMCKTDRFAGRDLDEDYDDRCMEANFDDIMREEKRSEKLAKKEDAEQLRLIEEEERVRKQKKQKLSH